MGTDMVGMVVVRAAVAAAVVGSMAAVLEGPVGVVLTLTAVERGNGPFEAEVPHRAFPV